MTQQVVLDSPNKRSLPIAGQAPLDIERELAEFEATERARLGLEKEEHWVEDMANLMFTKSERSKVTLLIGGLTMAQDYLIGAAFSHVGYNTISMDAPDEESLRVGKEFGNRAQCNPTYFTVGNLVKSLIHLRDKKGMSTEEIIDKYVFLTAGACGPCRFGMYVTEYRKALRDAGFDGFRVMLFQQQGGLSQASGEESGLELNPKFFIGLLKGLVAGDVLNGIGYRLRPFEVEAGATDKALEEAKKICHDALLNGKSILRALHKSKQLFKAVKVDRTIPKPKTAIIGEFWAMTTEGAGNYALQRFLEQEGSEADIQFVSAWLLYNVWELRHDTKNRAKLRAEDGGAQGLAGAGEYGVFQRQIGLWAADKAIRLGFQTFAHAVGFYGYHLPDMDQIADLAAPYYNNDLRGGEGHMEVGKLIVNVAKNKANMTLSVKPFGCMPSSGVSDGVQSLITEKFPGTIFCAVETSGDGAVNFYSRVQMYLFKAKQAAQAELDKALQETGVTLDQVRGFIEEHPRYASALHKAPHKAGCTAADVVYEVAEQLTTTRSQRLVRTAKRVLSGAKQSLGRAVREAPETARTTAHFTREGAKELMELCRDQAPGLAQKSLDAARSKAAQVLPLKRESQQEEVRKAS